MNVTVLGTGIMGAGMTRTMLREGLAVSVWNRTAARAEHLAAEGATVVADAADSVRGADVVLTVLNDAGSVLEVAEAIADDLADAVWLQTSTIGLDGIRRVAALADERGLSVLDAPVLGSKGPAEQGTLVCLVSGDDRLVARATPVLEAIGAKTVNVGPEIGQASTLKLVCNAWTATLTGALGQSIAMAESLGLDPAQFLGAIDGSPTDMPYAHVKGDLMLAGDYPTSFAVDGVLKDVALIRAAAQEGRIPEDLLAATQALFRDAAEQGHGSDDMAAVREAFRGAGSPGHG
jgi:3-hydroxyisobutyrate dehydrogenase